jgi:transcriptional regulator with XRE-family HTH domain
MNLADVLKTVREAKGLSQKELAGLVGMAQAQYSRIESSKTDPSFTAVSKIAKALGVSLSELFQANDTFKEVNSFDKTLMEKIRLMDSLEENEKKSIFHIIDMAISKKRMKDSLQNLISIEQADTTNNSNKKNSTKTKKTTSKK